MSNKINLKSVLLNNTRQTKTSSTTNISSIGIPRNTNSTIMINENNNKQSAQKSKKVSSNDLNINIKPTQSLQAKSECIEKTEKESTQSIEKVKVATNVVDSKLLKNKNDLLNRKNVSPSPATNSNSMGSSGSKSNLAYVSSN